MICTVCSHEITQERADAVEYFDLPKTCFECSRVEAPLVLMSFEHKTAGQAFVVPNNSDGSRNSELVRKATRCHSRSR